jgi:hypothetical protein
LVEQIAVRTMNFDAVEPCLFRVLGAVTIGLDDVRKLLGLQGARRDIRPLRTQQAHVSFRRDRARGNGKGTVVINGIGDAPDVPELKEDSPACSVHALDDRAPALDLLVGPDAGGVRITDARGRDRGRLGKDEAGGRALHIIVAHQRVRNAARTGRSVARQRRHEDAVGNFQIANLEGVEQGGH